MNIVVDLKVISFTVTKTLKELTKNKKISVLNLALTVISPIKYGLNGSWS